MSHAALLFQFAQEDSARTAFDTLQELGYDPQLHEGGRLHIHVIDEDLTSALEIVQSHGGALLEQAPAEEMAITAEAYGLDAVLIPAHTVNEDWAPHYSLASEERQAAESDSSDKAADARTDDSSYDYFEAR